MVVGQIVQLWRHPVKSMQGEALGEVQLGPLGIEGDRALGVRPVGGAKVLSAKREARLLQASARTAGGEVEVTLPDGRSFATGDAAIHAALSGWLGRDVRLEPADTEQPVTFDMNVQADDDDSPIVEFPTPPGTFFDAAPVHVLTTASLRAMAKIYPDGNWDVRRFRPGLLIDTDGEAFREDEWIGSGLRVGGAEIMTFAPTVRCVMTTRAQPWFERDLGIVKAVNRNHDCNLGAYGVVRQPGPVRVGDPVELVS